MSLETRVWARGATRALDVLIETVNHHDPEPLAQQPMRTDARLWIVGPTFRRSQKHLTFLPDEQPLVYRGHKQQVIREVRDHVHDTDWCYGRPKSSTGFSRELPPLWNGVARTDAFSNAPIGTPEDSAKHGTESAEYIWLIDHTNDHPLDTLSLLHEHQAEALLLDEALADAIDDTPDTVTTFPLSDPPVVRRIEWEREQAQSGPTTKFYLTAAQDGSDDVTWYQRKGTPEPDDASLLDGMMAVQRYTQQHGIHWFHAALIREEFIQRAAFYGADWMYSLLKPGTLRTYFSQTTPEQAATQALFWELRMPDLDDPYREDLVELDDDLHRPEPAYRLSRRKEIDEARWRAEQSNEADPEPYYGKRDRYGRWRLHQEFVDILAIEGFTINSAPAIGWDDTIPLRDNEKRVVVSTTRSERTGKTIQIHWYSRWHTERRTDFYEGRIWQGKDPIATVNHDPVEQFDYFTLCTSEGCRECQWRRYIDAYKRRVALIIAKHKRSA